MSRKRTVSLNSENGLKLASINFPMDQLEWLDDLCKRNSISRSEMVTLIIEDFKDNKRTITITKVIV